jgi:flavodoxin
MKKNRMKKAAYVLLGGVVIMMTMMTSDVSAKDPGMVLIAYFSRAGENYNVGHLKVGNTAVMAGYIHERLSGSDIFQIEPVVPYPDKYDECTKIAKKEQHENARPAVKTHIADINKYDVIYIGYPIWWGTMPQIVCTFFEGYDLSGKTIIPFCTNEGSGFGSSVNDLKKKCPKSKFLDGLAVRGSGVKKAQKEVNAWIDKTMKAVDSQ